MTGRPSKLTSDTEKRVCDALRLGATFEHAAQYGGISYDSFNEWRKRGKREKERIERATKNKAPLKKEMPFLHFFEATKKAEGDSVVGWLAKIESAANQGNWQAAAWKLERRYPDQYGKKAIDLNHKGKVEVRHNWRQMVEQARQERDTDD